MTSAADIRARIDAAPMSSTQIGVIAITFLLSAVDGYDVLSVTFAAPGISTDFSIGKAALGIVLAAGLAGMALGAFLLAPLADTFGRKTMILVSLVLMAAGMLACAYAGTIEALALWRVVTGLGIGACVAVINPIAAEFANARRRPLTISIMAVGYPVGGVIGGLAAAALLHNYGWHAVFVAGFAAAGILIPVVIWLLPESLGYLLAKPRRNGLARINLTLGRCGQPLIADIGYADAQRSGYAEVFALSRRGATVWLVAVNMLFVLAVYFVLSWLPQLVADAGFAPSVASLASAIASSAGVVGGLLLGALAQRGRLRELVGGGVIAFGLATAAFGLAPPTMAGLLVAAGVCGFFLFGASCGMYATLASTFPDAARAAGTGFVSGMGRVSSAIAPVLAGGLFSAGLTRAQVSIAFAACALLAGLLLLWGWRRFRIA